MYQPNYNSRVTQEISHTIVKHYWNLQTMLVGWLIADYINDKLLLFINNAMNDDCLME